MMATVSAKIPFIDLCLICEKISSKRGKDKRKPLTNFIAHWRDYHFRFHKNNPTTEDSFYPALRLLLPQFEKERGAYGIKEMTLAKLYIEILSLNKESVDAQKLLNYRNPHASKTNAGDFATVAYFVLLNRTPKDGTLTIADVNTELDGVALSHANRDKDGVKRHLLQLLRKTSAMEQKWLIRMIMKELKIGLSEQSVLDVLHPDAKDLYDVTNSLQKVCLQLKDPGVRLHEIEISMFAPFRPMLADRTSPEKVEKVMKNNVYYIETKLDGERMQLHKRGDEFKYFSRGANEYTESFGGNRREGNLTPYIAELFKADVQECILDGEMVGYNSETKCIGSKSENFDVKALRDGDAYSPCFIIFDILFHNGKVLSNVPLKDRIPYMAATFSTKEGKLMLTTRAEATSKQEAAEALNLAIDQREEGIVIKDPNSVYRPNTRKGGWFKIKPEYVDSMMDQLDLIIVGGYFGEGHRRSGMISHFLLAVAVPPKDGDEYPSEFHTITKVGSGYSLSELYELCQKLNEHWKTYDKRRPPANVILAPGHKEKPDLWVEPSNSYIVQVKAAELMNSGQFKTGCTLRFPRVEKVRYDKPWHQCMTTTELDELRKLAAGKLATKHLLIDEDGEFNEEGESPKKKTRMKTDQIPTMAPQFQTLDVSTITKVSKLFQGKEFCVVNGFNREKQELERLIVQHGGSLVQNPGRATFSVIADRKSLRVNNLIASNLYDVVKSGWLLACLEDNQLLLRTPSDFLHMSSTTAALLSEHYDQYGDSYTESVTLETLKKIFSSMSPKELLTPQEIHEVEHDYFPNTSPCGLFRLCDVYLDTCLVVGEVEPKIPFSSLHVTKSKLMFHGATISTTIHKQVTHVVVSSRDVERVGELRRINRNRKKKFHLVTELWVEQSIERTSLMNERNYEP